MKSTCLAAVVVMAACLSVAAADQSSDAASHSADVHPQTIVGAAVIAPGKYVTTVTPGFDKAMGKNLANAVKKLPGLTDVSTKVEDGLLKFTVKENSKVRLADIQHIVAKTCNGAVIVKPVLQGTMTPQM